MRNNMQNLFLEQKPLMMLIKYHFYRIFFFVVFEAGNVISNCAICKIFGFEKSNYI